MSQLLAPDRSLPITQITESDAESFRACLDAVAREKRFLALLEAPALEEVREFVLRNVRDGVPQVLAKDGDRVVGWCDISPGWHHALRHCGSLGMGVLSSYRGRGLGRRLLRACLDLASAAGVTRVELEARADNEAALELYRRFGFEHEGRKRNGMKIDGQYVDTIPMGLVLDEPAGREIPVAVLPYWQAFVSATPKRASHRFYEAFYFSDNEADANELSQLVLAGIKRATAALVTSFSDEGKPLPRPGDLSVVTNWAGEPVCIIETSRIDIVPCEEVSEEFAATEGEGDGSLRYWREVHWAYYQRECTAAGRTFDARMMVVCERFELVYP